MGWKGPSRSPLFVKWSDPPWCCESTPWHTVSSMVWSELTNWPWNSTWTWAYFWVKFMKVAKSRSFSCLNFGDIKACFMMFHSFSPCFPATVLFRGELDCCTAVPTFFLSQISNSHDLRPRFWGRVLRNGKQNLDKSSITIWILWIDRYIYIIIYIYILDEKYGHFAILDCQYYMKNIEKPWWTLWIIMANGREYMEVSIVHSHGGTPIAGWLKQLKIHL